MTQSMTTGDYFMAYQRGDFVLLPFPFTDLSAAKTRPAVVVSSEIYGYLVKVRTVGIGLQRLRELLPAPPVAKA